jgi:predicted HNH restriction endonuclease
MLISKYSNLFYIDMSVLNFLKKNLYECGILAASIAVNMTIKNKIANATSPQEEMYLIIPYAFSKLIAVVTSASIVAKNLYYNNEVDDNLNLDENIQNIQNVKGWTIQ